MKIPRGAETMKMVWHEQIVANQPSVGFQPGLVQKLMCGFVGQPGPVSLRGYRKQYDI
jgi:hypothetical protein